MIEIHIRNKKFQEALSLSYELEGLLDISLLRDELPNPLRESILYKAARIKEIVNDALLAEASDSELASENENEEIDTSDVSSSESAEEEAEEVTQEAAEEEAEEDIKAEVGTALFDDIPEEEDDEEDNTTRNKPETDLKKQFEEKKRAKPTFSINDRFLYSRELFNGKIDDFEKAMTHLAGLDNYEEAEEYFYSEWEFDPENPVVEDFMIGISRYFTV